MTSMDFICQRYKNLITSVTNFDFNWIKEDSKRLQHIAAVKHTKGKVHKEAFKLHIIQWDKCERSNRQVELTVPKNQQGIVYGIYDYEKY